MNNKGQKGLRSLVFLAILSSLYLFSDKVGYASEVVPAKSNQNGSATSVAGTKKKTKGNQAKAVTANENQSEAPSITTEKATTATTETNVTNEQPSYSTDPLEGFNRVMFTFNDKLDTYFMKPIATLYSAIMPKPLNAGIHNFYNNIGELPVIANDFLQFNFFQMVSDVWRLTINTTLGIGGFIDMASRMGIPFYSNDFGLTLARWGYTDSTYLVLPFFGPSTIRDGLGLPVDYYGFSVYPHIDPESTRYQIYALGVVDRRAQLLQFQPVFEEVALNKYVFTRNAYMQRRAFQMEQNRHLGYANRNKVNTTSPSK